jgi:superfamily II DNA or RNA helicase
MLREYQQKAVDAVFDLWDSGQESVLLVMATGTGKTYTFAKILERALRSGGRGMVVAHREELIAQAAGKIHDATGMSTEIEMASSRADSGHMYRRADVVVASIQTLLRRGERFENFKILVLDEAHHYVSSAWRAFIEAFKKNNPGVLIVGVTATPDRLDEEAMGQLFGHVAYRYEINQAIDEGYLVPVRESPCFISDMDFSGVDTTAGDLNSRQVAEIIGDERALHKIAFGIATTAAGKKSIVFAPPGFKTCADGTSFRVSEKLTEMLNDRYWPGQARLITDETDKDLRRQLLREYKAGLFRCLVNVGIATEGFDEPSIEVVHMVRKTKSRALYAQMIGRGTRTLPGVVDGIDCPVDRRIAIAASEKPSVLVVDYGGNAGRHKLISMVDILGGKRSAAVQHEAKRLVSGRGSSGPVDVQDAIDEAEKVVARQEADAKRAEEALRRKHIRATSATVTLGTSDPFDIFDVKAPSSRAMFRNSEPCTLKQANLLKKYGIRNPEALSKADASRMIGECLDRSRKGLASFRQVEFLIANGVRDTAKMTYTQANQLMAKIKGERMQGVTR